MSLNFFFPEKSPAADVDNAESPCGQPAKSGTTWLPHRSTLSRLPTWTLRIVHVSSGTLFWKKKKFRLISGHFEKFRLLYEKRKVETHI